MRPQTRIRIMRRPGTQRNREAPEIRQTYFDPALRTARAQSVSADRSEDSIRPQDQASDQDQEN